MNDVEEAIAHKITSEIRRRIEESSEQLRMLIRLTPEMSEDSACAHECERNGLAIARRICGHVHDEITNGTLNL